MQFLDIVVVDDERTKFAVRSNKNNTKNNSHLIRAINIKLKTKTLESNVLFSFFLLFLYSSSQQQQQKKISTLKQNALFIFSELWFLVAFYFFSTFSTRLLFSFSLVNYFIVFILISLENFVFYWMFVLIYLHHYLKWNTWSWTRSRFAPDNFDFKKRFHLAFSWNFISLISHCGSLSFRKKKTIYIFDGEFLFFGLMPVYCGNKNANSIVSFISAIINCMSPQTEVKPRNDNGNDDARVWERENKL